MPKRRKPTKAEEAARQSLVRPAAQIPQEKKGSVAEKLGFKSTAAEEESFKEDRPEPGPIKKPEKPAIFRDPTGRKTGIELPDGRVFLGLGQDEVDEIAGREAEKKVVPPGAIDVKQRAHIEEQKGILEEQFREAGVFDPAPEIVPITTPEQENLGVMGRIAKSLIPSGIFERFNLNKVLENAGKERLNEAEVQIGMAQVTNAIDAAAIQSIDTAIDEQVQIMENAIPLLGIGKIVGGVIVGGVLTDAIGQFVGSDKEVRNLEFAMTNLNTIYADITRAVNKGMTPQAAFDQLNKMEAVVNHLERLIQQAANTSPNIAISLRGRGIETKILQGRQKLQATRIEVASIAAQRAFGEVDVPGSMAFLQEMETKYKGGG